MLCCFLKLMPVLNKRLYPFINSFISNSVNNGFEKLKKFVAAHAARAMVYSDLKSIIAPQHVYEKSTF